LNFVSLEERLLGYRGIELRNVKDLDGRWLSLANILVSPSRNKSKAIPCVLE
jgi:hypothetical protein